MTRHGKVTATEANRSFSRMLDRVRRGERIDITSHGKVVAEIVPKVEGDEDERVRRQEAWERLLTRLKSQERVVIGPWTRAELYQRD